MRDYRLLVCCFLAVACVATAVDADVPHQISYQGRVTDSIGNPVDTTADLTFTIFADAEGSTSLWTETHPDVVIQEGIFSVSLGQFSAFGPTVFSGSTRYVGVQLGGGPMSDPLVAIISSAYSLRSARSDTADYALTTPGNGGGESGWTDDGTSVRLTSQTDSVGIGVNDPSVKLEVEGAVTAILGHSLGTGTAFGVAGSNDNDGTGVIGTSSSGKGVHGISGTGFGGYFYGPKSYVSQNLGIGTEEPTEMLHIYDDGSGANSFLKIQSAHPSNWGETGLRFQTPQNTWRFRMDDDLNGQIPDGAIGLRSQSSGEVMTWRENGRVGIGTTDPNYPLEVVSSDTPLRSRSTGSGIGLYTSSSTGFGVYSDASKNFMGGLTGFGQTNPSHRLTVNGAIGIQESGTTRFHLNYYNNGLNISETSVADYRLFIEEGGEVGIGTGKPGEKLHVAGNAKVDDTIKVGAFEADILDRHNIIDEVGIASATSTSVQSLTSSWASYLSKQITVPSAGYILAFGIASITLDHGIAGVSRGSIGFSDLPDDINGGTQQRIYLDPSVNTGTYGVSVPCRRLFYVPSQGTYTFYLLAMRHKDNDAKIANKQMDLIFLPTPYGAKNMADGSDAGYATTDRIATRPASSVITNGKSAASSDIDQLRDELATLQGTVEELQSRLDDEGR